jgi:dipeptidyl aminopeptidase/acylaminoacyl peptidase
VVTRSFATPLRIVAALLGCFLIGLFVFFTWVGYGHYRAVLLDFEPMPATALAKNPAKVGIAGLEEVSFRSSDDRLAGWYVPSRNRAAVVLTHGTNADRSSMVDELRILSEAGFGVLAFDWPGEGASEGSVRWGAENRRALTAAIDWLTKRADVDANRIGGLGFSMGGFNTAQVAARESRLRAVVLLAAPSDYVAVTRWQNRQWGFVSEFAASLAVRYTGMAGAGSRPIDVVHEIAPRPLLVIGGDADGIVPPFMTRALYAAAREPKSLWIVPGAHHGDYDQVAGPAFRSRLVQFFSANLLSDSALGAAPPMP